MIGYFSTANKCCVIGMYNRVLNDQLMNNLLVNIPREMSRITKRIHEQCGFYTLFGTPPSNYSVTLTVDRPIESQNPSIRSGRNEPDRPAERQSPRGIRRAEEQRNLRPLRRRRTESILNLKEAGRRDRVRDRVTLETVAR